MDKELLFKPRLPEAEVEIPGLGTVRVRALNRGEAMMVHEAKGNEATERRMIALGMVDPKLTEDEVAQWQRAATAGELNAVSERIGQLSGMLDGAPKEAYKSVRRRP